MILACWVVGWLLAYAMRLHAISSGASFLDQALSIKQAKACLSRLGIYVP
jgi:hypothetical protein